MSNTVLLSWDKPTALAQWQKEQGQPELTRYIRIAVIGALVSAVVLSGMVVIFNRSGTNTPWSIAFVTVVVQNVFWPLLNYRELREKHVHTQQRYEIREDGIVIIGHKKRKLHPWKTVRNYQIEPITELPPFANLTIQVGPLFNREFITLGFDLTQIPESKLHPIFAQYFDVGSHDSHLTAASH